MYLHRMNRYKLPS
jgi:hypothetical protein